MSSVTDTPADALAAIRFVTLPDLAIGSLTLRGAMLPGGETVPVGTIVAGELQFETAGNGPAATSFEFQVQDDGGTAGGGQDWDLSPATLTIEVVWPHDWHNEAFPQDVDADGTVAPKDAIAVINYLNGFGAGRLPELSTDRHCYDVNNDGFVAASDALAIINWINAHPRRPETGMGESEQSVDPMAADILFDLVDLEFGKENRSRRL
jgi:hypothetical protein